MSRFHQSELMKGLPRDIDLTPLVQSTVIQLCFGLHQLQIHFDNACQIIIEGACELQQSGQPALRIEDFVSSGSALCGVIGERTRSATRTESGGLLLMFEDGAKLECLRDTDAFEAFQIVMGGDIFVA
jgi:hypothetical protein